MSTNSSFLSENEELSPTLKIIPKKPKVEIKLNAQLKARQNRIERLRKEKEEAELATLQSKPKILKKSRYLAARAEKKLFQNESYSYTHHFLSSRPNSPDQITGYSMSIIHQRTQSNEPREIESEWSFGKTNSPFSIQDEKKCHFEDLRPQKPLLIPKNEQKQARPSSNTTHLFIPIKAPAFETPSILKIEKCESDSRSKSVLKSPEKESKHKRRQSIYNMTVLERNEYWLEQKEEKLKLKIEENEARYMKECTFEPLMYSRIPFECENIEMKELTSLINSNESSMTTSMHSPFSVAGEVDRSFMTSLVNDYTPISPVKFKVSYNTGCDIGGFMARRK